MTKYIFVTGGVVSSIGKGIAAASLGRLLKNRGLKVTIQKFDPYINVDPGTMSPYLNLSTRLMGTFVSSCTGAAAGAGGACNRIMLF